MRTLTLVVRGVGKHATVLYVACVIDGEVKESIDPDYPYSGASPDEALGHLMREEMLAGTFDEPVRLLFDIQSDVEP